GLELEISLPRWGAFDFSDDLVRTLVRSGRHPDLPAHRQPAANASCTIPDRSRMADCSICRRLAKSAWLAAGCSDVDFVCRICHCGLCRNKSPALRPAGGRDGIGRRLSYRIQLDE